MGGGEGCDGGGGWEWTGAAAHTDFCLSFQKSKGGKTQLTLL